MEDRPFREMMAMRKSLDDFGLKVKEPEHQYEDDSVDFFYHDLCDRIDQAQKGNNPRMHNFSMNGYPYNGTNAEKMKFIQDTHKAMDEAEFLSGVWKFQNYGGRRVPKNWRGDHV